MLVDIDGEGRIQLPKGDHGKQVVLEKIGGYFHILPLSNDLKGLYVEISSFCNLHCKGCLRTFRKREEEGFMEEGLFKKILSDTKSLPQLERIFFGGYGEPLLHPQLPSFIAWAKEKGLRVGLSSNGTLLSRGMAEDLLRSGLYSITISLDSTNPTLFRELRRGGELSTIQENLLVLKDLKEDRKTITPLVHGEMVVMKQNIQELRDLYKTAYPLGISQIIISHLLAHDRAMWKEVLYQEQGSSGQENPYQTMMEKEYLNFNHLNLPGMTWGSERSCSFIKDRSMVINWQGIVSPCYALMYSYPYHLFGRDKEVTSYPLGDLREESLLEIWQKEEYLRFRKQVEDYRFPSCQDCAINERCTYAKENQDCFGNSPSCADCLWSQRIISCP